MSPGVTSLSAGVWTTHAPGSADPPFRKFRSIRTRPSSPELLRETASTTCTASPPLHSKSTANRNIRPEQTTRRSSDSPGSKTAPSEPPDSPTVGLRNLRSPQPGRPTFRLRPRPSRSVPAPAQPGLPDHTRFPPVAAAPACARQRSSWGGRGRGLVRMRPERGRLPARISRSYAPRAAGDGWPAGGGRASRLEREVRSAGRAAPVLCGILEVSSVASRLPARLRPALPGPSHTPCLRSLPSPPPPSSSR